MNIIQNTLKEMFITRKYQIIQENDMVIYAINSRGEKICSIITNAPKINLQIIKHCNDVMYEEDINRIIIVYKDGITSQVNNFVNDIKNTEGKIFEFFTEDELQFNILKHCLQPKFEVLSKKDADEHKRKYLTNNDGERISIPILLKSDPVAKFLGLKVGDIVKITRKRNGYITYRIVK
jgi:DNA-directed RNA polymerases I, II, and III subunit RPABC1